MFLDYANQIGAIHKERSIDDEWYPSEFLNAECLRIKPNNEYTEYIINYRTNYNDRYMDDVIIFGDNERNFLKSILSNKKENKMSNMPNNDIKRLIEKHYRNEVDRLQQIRNEKIDEEVLKTEIGKQADLLATLVNATNIVGKMSFKSYIDISILPLSTQRKINDINKEFEIKNKELDDKCQELDALLSICENYEQKVKLLKKYAIIK